MEVFYDDPSHTYYTLLNEVKQVYTSATTLIGRYKQPFEARKMAEITARKRGNTPEYWLNEWKKTSKEACEYGTEQHNKREQLLYDSPQSKPVFNTNNVHLINYHTLEDGIYPELKLWHHGWHIAGRADKCIIETINGKRFIHIEDYKTNKELKHKSFVFRDGTQKMMKAPVAHIQDCNMQHYTLQLSIYQYMAEYLGFLPGNRTIIHIPLDGIDTPYDVHYMRTEVVNILSHAKKHKYI
jgi:hypothetical protein